jgi:hypothetical protein
MTIGSDDKGRDDEDSADEADNALKEDELEQEIDGNDDKASLSHWKVYLDNHRRKCQVYLAEKEALHSSNFVIKKSLNAVKLGVGVQAQEKGNTKKNDITVEQRSKRT